MAGDVLPVVVDEVVDVARAVVTVDGGVVVLEVVEVDGVLVEVGSGVPVDLVSLVVVEGLPELESAA